MHSPAEAQRELALFEQLQAQLAPLFQRVFPDPLVARSVVVIPSLSLDAQELEKIRGVCHYEERMLCMLMLLRLPRTQLIYVTSQPIYPAIIDYYLHLLSGIPSAHARQRLQLFSCYDGSSASLSAKILARPRLVQRIRHAIREPANAHMNCFTSTELERRLAVQLGIPLYACDPRLAKLGSKSGGREIFRAAGVELLPGVENLRDAADVCDALAALKASHPALRRGVVKLNEGFSGEGNAVFDYSEAPKTSDLSSWIRQQLPHRLQYAASNTSWEPFHAKLAEMGGVVEAWLEDVEASPSVQCRIDPLGRPEVISTHDQVLGGPNGQVFLGCSFPARDPYRLEIGQLGRQIAEVVRERKVLGRFGVDFVSVPRDGRWKHYALEINLRKGGTTHPYMMLQFLTDGHYDETKGLFLTPLGHPRYYYASDNLQSEAYQGLLPEDLVDITVRHGLHFHGATQQGVVFHLIGALSEFGKLGMVAIADTPRAARTLFDKTREVLDLEANQQP